MMPITANSCQRLTRNTGSQPKQKTRPNGSHEHLEGYVQIPYHNIQQLSLDLSRGSRSLSALSRGRPRLVLGAAAADL